MNKLPYASNFRELVVYQKSRQLSREKTFPKEELYSLIDQIRRSSRSIGAQIAEAWAKRRYERHFISKLTDADGKQYETQHWIDVASDCGYLNTKQTQTLTKTCREIGRLLGCMIAKASLFCDTQQKTLREPMAEYFVEE